MGHNLMDLLKTQKAAIAAAWVEKILCSYPEEGANFFRNQKNQFSNPIGHTISKNVPDIFEEMIGQNDRLRLRDLLKDVIKIRAVQEFPPSLAIRFVFSLKEAIREVLEPGIFENLSSGELQQVDALIDETALIAFDLYMECREKIFKLRLNEAKLRSGEALLMQNENS